MTRISILALAVLLLYALRERLLAFPAPQGATEVTRQEGAVNAGGDEVIVAARALDTARAPRADVDPPEQQNSANSRAAGVLTARDRAFEEEFRVNESRIAEWTTSFLDRFPLEGVADDDFVAHFVPSSELLTDNGMDDARQQAQAILDEHHPLLLAHADEAARKLADAKEHLWLSGALSPRNTFRTELDKTPVLTSSAVVGGESLAYCVYREDYPLLDAALTALTNETVATTSKLRAIRTR